MSKAPVDWTRFGWVVPLLFFSGLAIYRYGDDWYTKIFSPSAVPGEKYSVPISPPQFIYACRNADSLGHILQQVSNEVRMQTFEALRRPGLAGLVRCDYLQGPVGQYAQFNMLTQLTLVREAFVLPEAPSLGSVAGAEFSVRLYKNEQTSDQYYVYLAHPKIDGVYQEWAIDFMSTQYGQ